MSLLTVVRSLVHRAVASGADHRRYAGRQRRTTQLAVEVLESRVCPSLLVASNRTDNVLRYDDVTGEFLGVFAEGGGLTRPGALALGPDGNLYVASNATNNVLRFDIQTGKFLDVFASSDELQKPSGLVFGPDDNLYVNSHNTDSVLRFDGKTGKFLDVFVPPGSGGLSGPSEGLAFGPDRNLYVNSSQTDSVLRYDGTTGKFLGVFTSGGDLMHPGGLTFGPDTNLYVNSHIESRILRYDGRTGKFLDVFSTGNGLRNPTVLVFGPDGNLYVNSRGSQSVLRYDGETGEFIDTFIPPGGPLNAPTGILFLDDGGGGHPGPHPTQTRSAHHSGNDRSADTASVMLWVAALPGSVHVAAPSQVFWVSPDPGSAPASSIGALDLVSRLVIAESPSVGLKSAARMGANATPEAVQLLSDTVLDLLAWNLVEHGQ
jgi:WD40 repeat protein